MDPVDVKAIYCRICGIKSKKSVKIFSRRGRGMGLESKILKCLMLSVKRSDQLPTRVCFPCIDRLDDFSQFLLHVKQAQVKLRAMLKSQGVHVKDERNNELITTWKALLAHQERESENGGRGRKRKRKLDEKIYDSSDSLSSDSVSDESSSDGGDPYDTSRNPPSKKISVTTKEMSSSGFSLKSEAIDAKASSPGKSFKAQKSTSVEVPGSQNVPLDLNSIAPSCKSLPLQPEAPSSDANPSVSHMQEDEITTSQDNVPVIQGSSNSVHQPANTTTAGVTVTVSPPIMFPTQGSNSMIVLPGARMKSSSGGMVPFYIWNVPKSVPSNDATRKSLPQVGVNKHSYKVTVSEKRGTSGKEASCYDLTKPFILPKPAVSSVPTSEATTSNSLPTSTPSHSSQISASSHEPGTSTHNSGINCVNQGTLLQHPDQFEMPVKTNFVIMSTDKNFPSMLSTSEGNVSSEQSSCASIPSVSSDDVSQTHNTTNQVLREVSQMNNSQLSVGNLREKVCHMMSSVGDNSQSCLLTPLHESHCISLSESQRVSVDSIKSTMPSCNNMDDESGNPSESVGSLLLKSSPRIHPVTVASKVSLNSGESVPSNHTCNILSANELKRLSEGVNSSASEGVARGSSEHNESKHPSTSTSAPVKPAISQRSFANLSDAPLSGAGMQSLSMLHHNASSGPESPGKERSAKMHDICDIPPLIPIAESLKLKQHGNIECEAPSMRVTIPNFSLDDQDTDSGSLVIEEEHNSDQNNPDSCVEGAHTSTANGSVEGVPSSGDISGKSSAPLHKSSDWNLQESMDGDFTVDPDYSVVKCCLCSADSYPFLITLASASDHCKFIHSHRIGSFGCIKCDFITDQQQQISEQLQSLHCHVSSGCVPPSVRDEVSSPQKMPEDESDTVEMKQEPVDVYETAMMNLKNSLRKVKMPRFRKLITSCKSSSDGVEKYPLKNIKEEVNESGKGTLQEEDVIFVDTSRNGLVTRKGSTYICRICGKKSNTKHQIKMHLSRHKRSERDRFLYSNLRNGDAEESSVSNDGAGSSIGFTREKMVFHIPAIKVEKEDSPQSSVAMGDVDRLMKISESPSSSLSLSVNDSESKDTKKTVSVVTNCPVESQTIGKKLLSPNTSNVKIPFVKGEPGKFSASDKVTHKANTSDCFSFTSTPKGSSEGSEQYYVNHSRNFRSKPIVKPLFKSPTAPKDELPPASSSSTTSCTSVDLNPEFEKSSPSKPCYEVMQGKKTSKKLTLKFLKTAQGLSVTGSHVDGSHIQRTTDHTICHSQPSPQVHVRGNTSVMKMIRPKPTLEMNSDKKLTASLSHIPENSSSDEADSPTKSQSESMTVNGMVLKVPFIKLQRLNMQHIDPKICVGNQCSANDGGVVKVNEDKVGDSRSDAKLDVSKESCGNSSMQPSPKKPKKEPPEKSGESILGW